MSIVLYYIYKQKIIVAINILLICFIGSVLQVQGAVPITRKKSPTHIVLQDSTNQIVSLQELPPRPKTGIGLILTGFLLLIVGFVFGIGLLLFFLLGFSIGESFYFQDIYLTAGVMLTGLSIFGTAVFMMTRGIERWKIYRRYKKLKKKALKAS